MAKKKKRLTLFRKPIYKKYAIIVSFKNPAEARESAKKLLQGDSESYSLHET